MRLEPHNNVIYFSQLSSIELELLFLANSKIETGRVQSVDSPFRVNPNTSWYETSGCTLNIKQAGFSPNGYFTSSA